MSIRFAVVSLSCGVFINQISYRWSLVAMITTNGIHIAVARLACSFLFLKNATPQVSVTHWRQATLSAASNEASGALSANTNLSRRRIATNSEIWFIISFISSPDPVYQPGFADWG